MYVKVLCSYDGKKNISIITDTNGISSGLSFYGHIKNKIINWLKSSNITNSYISFGNIIRYKGNVEDILLYFFTYEINQTCLFEDDIIKLKQPGFEKEKIDAINSVSKFVGDYSWINFISTLLCEPTPEMLELEFKNYVNYKSSRRSIKNKIDFFCNPIKELTKKGMKQEIIDIDYIYNKGIKSINEKSIKDAEYISDEMFYIYMNSDKVSFEAKKQILVNKKFPINTFDYFKLSDFTPKVISEHFYDLVKFKINIFDYYSLNDFDINDLLKNKEIIFKNYVYENTKLNEIIKRLKEIEFGENEHIVLQDEPGGGFSDQITETLDISKAKLLPDVEIIMKAKYYYHFCWKWNGEYSENENGDIEYYISFNNNEYRLYGSVSGEIDFAHTIYIFLEYFKISY